MAETKNTSRGSTGYTSWHAHTWTTTYNVDSNLKVRTGPGTGYAVDHRIYPGYVWYIAESLWGWGREPNHDWWSSLDFMTAGGTMDPTPGEFRVDSIDIQATRNNPWDKNLTVKYTIKSSNAAGTTESYYDWRVYCYAAKINGGEVQGDLYNRSRSIGGNGRWTHTFTYTIEETSTNSSVSLGNYGIWYTGNGSYRSIGGGVGQQLTFDIPPYNPKVVPKCTAINYSNRTDTSINITGTFDNGKGTIDKYRFKYKKDGGGWVELAETTSNSASLSSLTPNTKYWVGAKAHNEIGWGNYKEDSYFFTKPKANKPTVSASDIKHNSFKINVTKNSTNYPDINYYGASYRKDGTSSWTNFSNQASNEFTVSNLLPNTKYYIKGKTRTKTGLDGSTAWSVDSDEVVVYTKPKAGTSTVACVRNNTTNSLNIKVTPVGNTSNASTSTYVPSANTYQVRYRVSGTANWIESGTSTNQTITVSSLTANTSYEIQGRSRTRVGIDGTSTAWSNWSNSITVKVVKTVELTSLSYTKSNTDPSKVEAYVEFKQGYPDFNRIYYALTPLNVTDPGRVSGMYSSVGTIESDDTGIKYTTFNISKDYQGNPLLPNTKYKMYIYLNQYKANSDWYTAGLDLVSNGKSIIVSTPPKVATLKDVKCIQNNTYNSLKITATKNGTWSVFQGWQYRYKVSTDSDLKYSDWSTVGTTDRTITGLTGGETYLIQIRGTTGTAEIGDTFYSPIYELTIKVVRKPKITIELVRLKENEIGIKGTITDKGYPEVTRLDWQYSSNSFITLTYVPGTWNTFKTINFGSAITTSQNCTFTNLYHYAMYNVRAKLTQYKTGSQWYTAGLNHSFDFDINNIELAMYNSRTSRLKSDNGGWKQVKDIRGWNGTNWKNVGTNIEPTTNLDSNQVWALADNQIYQRMGWFYKNGDRHGGNKEILENFKVWIPGIDHARWKGSTNSDHAYGGNLFKNKVPLDFETMQTTNIDSNQLLFTRNSNWDIRKKKNSLSLKRVLTTTTGPFDIIFSIKNLDKVIDLDLVDSVYIEFCEDVIPTIGDLNFTSGVFPQFTSIEDPTQKDGEFQWFANLNRKPQHKFLICLPIQKILSTGLGYKFSTISFYNNSGTDFDHDPPVTSNIRMVGSIINISNFNIYYTLM